MSSFTSVINQTASHLNGTGFNKTEFWNVMLDASALGKTRVIVGMVVSGFCVFAFLIFMIARCCIEIYNDGETQKISRKLLPGSIFLLVIYFGAEFATAVTLVLGRCRVIEYYPTLIALDFIGLSADSTLLCFLLITFSARMYSIAGKENSLTTLFMVVYCVTLGIVAGGNLPAFLYKGFTDLVGPETAAALDQAGGVRFRVLGSYQALNVSFYGLYSGGVIGLAWITVRCMRQFRKEARILSICLWIVVASLAIRTAGKTLYSILFVLQHRTESSTMVLIHTIFYDLLSVIIYAAILVMLRSDSFNNGSRTTEEDGIRYSLAGQSTIQEEAYKLPQQTYVYTTEITDAPQEARLWRSHTAEYPNYQPHARGMDGHGPIEQQSSLIVGTNNSDNRY